MKARRLSEIAAVVGGRLVGEDALVTSVTADSRTAEPGSLFFALPGSKGDGAAFVGDALQRGAAGAVVRHDQGSHRPVIIVSDPLAALRALAVDERTSTAARVIGITGSTGKTLTKDLTAAVVGTGFKVHASPGSFNNEIGLPLTLLNSPHDVEVLVCEMGARGVGHIASLCEIARPQVGIVTNVGLAHLEFFGTKENIGRAKGELIRSLEETGTAILNGDDPIVASYARETRARVVSFGTGEADVRAERITLDDCGYATFDLLHDKARRSVRLGIPGEHMVWNALAAAAAGVALGMPLDAVAGALAEARGSRWRMEVFDTKSGVRVVNDAYNANPTSTAAALKAAAWMARGTRLCAVLGTMHELGSASREEHDRVGELVARLRVDRLITVGTEARATALAAVREGCDPDAVASYDDPVGAVADVRSWMRPGDVVLVKASRAVGLEVVAEALR